MWSAAASGVVHVTSQIKMSEPLMLTSSLNSIVHTVMPLVRASIEAVPSG